MWTLITVTGNGQVHESSHATKELCEQARSVALTGMTIEENAAADEAYAQYLKKWDEDHPWRDPRDDYERSILKGGGHGSCSWGGPYSLAYDSSTGKVREYPSGGMSMSCGHGESVELVRGLWVNRGRHSVKYAKCIPPEHKD
jgi:hypothetical protein